MRLCKVAFRGLTVFDRPTALDFDALGPGLVALLGRNGSGKTTSIEAVAGSIYKALPSRPGSLYDACHGRDAYIESTFEDADGHEVKARVQIDTDQRKTEGYLFVDGEPITTGRSKEFEVEVERRFGSYELFLSSTFASQNKNGNFLTMPRAQRKGLFVELLGLSRLEVLHEAAKAERVRVESELSAARAALVTIERELALLPDLEAARAAAQTAADAAAHRVEIARTEEAAAQAALERSRSAKDQLAALEDVVSSTMARVQSAQAELEAAGQIGPKSKKDAEARLQTLRSLDLDGRAKRARAAHEKALAAVEETRKVLRARLDGAPDIEAERSALAAEEVERQRLMEAARTADAAGSELDLAEQKEHRARERHESALRQHASEVKRLARASALLPEVPCTAVNVDLAGACPLLADARTAKAKLEDLSAEERAIQELRAESLAADRRLLEAREKAQAARAACDPKRLQDLDAIIRKRNAAISQAGAIESAREQLDGLAAQVTRADEALAAERDEVTTARQRVASEMAAIEEELTDALLAAEERVLAAQKGLTAAKSTHEDAEAKVAAFMRDTPDPALAEEGVASTRRERETAERELRAADQRLATANAQLEQVRSREGDAEAARRRVRDAETEAGDWTLLDAAFGRDGIQALEIDAAGPEVARLTNELLEACYGPRFSISFETLREKKSSPGEYSEAFDVKVYDGGEERQVEALSGGERVVVGEAVGLAIAIFNARKSGLQWRTIFRDETSGALDPESAVAYVDMLRRALSLGGFHQIVFISHQQDVWARADARLLFDRGRVEIERGTEAA